MIYYANPYLFLLLKEMFSYEVGFFFKEVTPLTATQYFQITKQRPTNIQEAKELISKMDFSSGKPPDESFYKHTWRQTTDFKFTKNRLDELARAILFLGDFSSWDNFCEKFQPKKKSKLNSNPRPGVIVVRPSTIFQEDDIDEVENYKECTYEELYEKGIIWRISNQVKKVIINRVMQVIADGTLKGKKYSVKRMFFNGSSIRSAEVDDLSELEILRARCNASPNLHNKHYLIRQDKTILYVFVNPYQKLTGQIAIVPVVKNFYREILNGIKVSAEFTVFDLDKNEIPTFLLATDLYALSKDVNTVLSKGILGLMMKERNLTHTSIFSSEVGSFIVSVYFNGVRIYPDSVGRVGLQNQNFKIDPKNPNSISLSLIKKSEALLTKG